MNSEDSPIARSLETLRATFRGRFEAAATEQALRNENATILGKKGELTAILAQMGSVPAPERKAIGELVNALRKDVEAAFEERLRAIERTRRDAELHAAPFDLTLPARMAAPLGHAHPISIVRDEIVDVLVSLGFAVHDGPEVELEENNFGKLGYPPDHPATDMQDTFWVDVRRKARPRRPGLSRRRRRLRRRLRARRPRPADRTGRLRRPAHRSGLRPLARPCPPSCARTPATSRCAP